MLPRNPNNGGTRQISEAHRFSEDLDLDDSTCSTPYVSAPSSPGREAASSGYFFSAPASPVHYMLSSSARSSAAGRYSTESTVLSTQASDSSAEFEFASKLSPNSLVAVGSMSSADELFCNGKIKPVKLSSHLQRRQILSPLVDLEIEEEEVERRGRDRDLKLRSRSIHRKARSLSPLRTAELETKDLDLESKEVETTTESSETTPSSSRSSSSGRNSKKWIFLKDLLHRSKSEGTAQSKDKDKDRFWSTVTFSPSKEKKAQPPQQKKKPPAVGKKPPANGISRRRSAHEVHYTTSRAQAEEMKKRTYLPYRQGLLGCLGFSSKGYGALTGFTKTLNPVDPVRSGFVYT